MDFPKNSERAYDSNQIAVKFIHPKPLQKSIGFFAVDENLLYFAAPIRSGVRYFLFFFIISHECRVDFSFRIAFEDLLMIANMPLMEIYTKWMIQIILMGEKQFVQWKSQSDYSIS